MFENVNYKTVNTMEDKMKVEYECIYNPHAEERLFRALSMLISEDDL